MHTKERERGRGGEERERERERREREREEEEEEEEKCSLQREPTWEHTVFSGFASVSSTVVIAQVILHVGEHKKTNKSKVVSNTEAPLYFTVCCQAVLSERQNEKQSTKFLDEE